MRYLFEGESKCLSCKNDMLGEPNDFILLCSNCYTNSNLDIYYPGFKYAVARSKI